ncbi:LPS export ABC transporter permease LptG [Rhodoferax fermentans]|uniref:LPS export ABC transporter permease LptG n=1 Tax=Rhodoferax fermentans TaxID=28066 RepID=A0A1T1AUI3_RHOFE|nr:LPS export ABC transporter permease LptG [Rhodoferax fermentans]MBK1682872.1 LPS export ABC transporter permease LptG [Rhodoferax fermentans]OOV07727.1 LPS export ABC transporter permease LptG [Rhodoferax fermentans]
MKTLRRLLYNEVIRAVSIVVLGFMSLFFFFDFIAEVKAVTQYADKGYTLLRGLTYVVLMIPNHLYELMPIAVLIGTIFVMARLAQSSEYTILRTSGLDPWRALKALLTLGMAFVLLTFAIGDYASPAADRAAQLLKARYTGHITVGQTGAWLKERQAYGTYAVNVGKLASDGSLLSVRIFEFNNRGMLASMTQGKSARIQDDEAWMLDEVSRTEFTIGDTDRGEIARLSLPSMRWPNSISAEMVSAALLKPEHMNTYDLFQYIQHLQANQQTAQRYEIEFWRKVFYPLSCLVMVVLALPFAYLHFRSGGIATYVFGGVMAGISFFLLNNVFGFIGNLQNWEPWLAAAVPGIIYSVLSLTAFAWLVLRR